MLFHNLSKLAAYERQYLKFIRSNEDRNIVIAIGNAAELGTPIGFKQLALLRIASSSTVARKLKQLVAGKAIQRIVRKNDGRMVSYVLTKKSMESFARYQEVIRALAWAGGDGVPDRE
jgi:DNA-binding MarR family transcriptional regulator